MSRTVRPVLEEQATIGALKMITTHVGKPCPTRREIMDWTGVQRQHVWQFLDRLQDRGLIEVEMIDPDPEHQRHKVPRLRRLRVVGGQWTGWTARFNDRKPKPPHFLAMMEGSDASP